MKSTFLKNNLATQNIEVDYSVHELLANSKIGILWSNIRASKKSER